MNVGNISITGLIARDFDIQAVITQLGQIRSKPIALLESRQAEHAQRLGAHQQLLASSLALSTAASALTDGTAFSQVTASSSDASAVVVGASAGAPVGEYELTVTQLAQAHKLGSAAIASSSEALGIAGEFGINGRSIEVSAGDSLAAIRDAINAAGAGVSASIMRVSAGDHRLTITSLASGSEGAIEVSEAEGSGVLAALNLQEIDAAQDAQFTVDGVAMTRSTNAVDDVLENVQLQLLRETGEEPVQVTIGANTSATVAAVESFVGAYNRVVEFINAHQSFDSDAEKGGLFFGSPAITSFESALRDQVSGLVGTLGGELKLASQIGLSFDSHDVLSLDRSKLLSALASDPEGVRRLFGVRSYAQGDAVQVVGSTSATRDSGAAGWEVQVTQAATRASATSALLTGGITADEILTINGKPVSLTVGMSLAQASERLNALFSAQRMEMTATVEGDRLAITHAAWGEAYSISISSSLDDGAGGTDLGRAIAGEAAVSRGRDVAGTIGGHAATGRGRLLTGDSGSPVAGLQLNVTAEAAGSTGTVRLSKGISARLADLIESMTGERGSLTRAAEGVTADIAAIDEQIAGIEAEVDRYIAKLQIDFAVMEAKMAESSTLLKWMESQMDYLGGNSQR